MLHGDDRSVAFTVEQALELVEQIGVDFGRKRFPLICQFCLLRLEARDAFAARAYIEFEIFALNFNLARFLFQRLHARCACG